MSNISNTYAPQFKAWQAKQLGSKPNDDMLTVAHAFGRPGKQSLALAMAMRPEGVSGAQVVMACGAPQNNHRRDLLASGYFKRDNTVPHNDQGHTVYKITLTPKGEAAMKRRYEAADKATLQGDAPKATKKAKGTGKRKPKGEAPAVAPAVTASEPAPVEGQADQPQA